MAEIVERVAKSEQALMWDLYKNAFSRNPESAAQDQCCYNKRAFFKALEDPDYHKILARVDGVVQGFALLTNNLQKARITYMRPERFEQMFPHMRGKIFYVTAICVAAGQSRKGLAVEILTKLVEHFENLGGAGAFDYAKEVIPTWQPLLERIRDRLIAQGKLKRKTLTYTVVGCQEYSIFC